MGDYDGGEFPAGERDEATLWLTAPALDQDDPGPPAFGLDSSVDVVQSVFGWTKGAISDAMFGSTKGAISDAMFGPTKGAISDAMFGPTKGAISDAMFGPTRGAISDAMFGSTRGAISDAMFGPTKGAISDAMFGPTKGAIFCSPITGIGRLADTGALSFVADVMSKHQSTLAPMSGYQPAFAAINAVVPSYAALSGYSSAFNAITAALPSLGELYGVGSSIQSTLADIATSRNNLAVPYGVGSGIDSVFPSIIKSIGFDFAPDLRGRPTQVRDLAERPSESTLEVPTLSRLLLPHEATADAEARDFLRMLRLALLTVQSRGQAGHQALLRLAKSTPSKATGLSLAVATVYMLMQHVPNFDEVVGDLANAIEVVLFPFGTWVIAKNADNK